MKPEYNTNYEVLKPGDIVSICIIDSYDVTAKILKNDTEKQLLTYKMLDKPDMIYSFVKYIGNGIETDPYKAIYDFTYTEDPALKVHLVDSISLNPVTKEKIAETYYDLSFDYCYRIQNGDKEIGIIILSETTDSETGPVFLEWIELSKENRGKGYMRTILERLKDLFRNRDSIKADCSEKYLGMYRHLGFVMIGYDDFREMNEISLYLHEPELISVI